MKNKISLFKVAMTGFCVALLLLTATPVITSAATISLTATNGTTLAGNTGNPIITTNVALITKYTVSSTNPVSAFIKFYDSPNTAITNLLGAYTNTTTYSTNFVLTYTNVVGNIQTNTNTVLVTAQAVTAASLREYRVIHSMTIQASNSLTYIPDNPHPVALGLMCTNGLPLQLTIEYIPLR